LDDLFDEAVRRLLAKAGLGRMSARALQAGALPQPLAPRTGGAAALPALGC